jgi:hypothetical protein
MWGYSCIYDRVYDDRGSPLVMVDDIGGGVDVNEGFTASPLMRVVTASSYERA